MRARRRDGATIWERAEVWWFNAFGFRPKKAVMIQCELVLRSQNGVGIGHVACAHDGAAELRSGGRMRDAESMQSLV